jgi:hypothetical protein
MTSASSLRIAGWSFLADGLRIPCGARYWDADNSSCVLVGGSGVVGWSVPMFWRARRSSGNGPWAFHARTRTAGSPNLLIAQPRARRGAISNKNRPRWPRQRGPPCARIDGLMKQSLHNARYISPHGRQLEHTSRHAAGGIAVGTVPSELSEVDLARRLPQMPTCPEGKTP